MSQKTKKDVESASKTEKSFFIKTIYGAGIFLVVAFIVIASVAVILTSKARTPNISLSKGACDSNPCQNGGKCSNIENNEYSCDCDNLTDFYGDMCQYNISTSLIAKGINDIEKYKPCTLIPRSSNDSIPTV